MFGRTSSGCADESRTAPWRCRRTRAPQAHGLPLSSLLIVTDTLYNSTRRLVLDAIASSGTIACAKCSAGPDKRNGRATMIARLQCDLVRHPGALKAMADLVALIAAHDEARLLRRRRARTRRDARRLPTRDCAVIHGHDGSWRRR